MNGEPLFARHQARAARHRPTLHHAIEFEPQIVMQPRRRVLLDHERTAATLDLATARLRGDAERALLAILLKCPTLLAHDLSPKTGFHFSGSCVSPPSSAACVSRLFSWPMCAGPPSRAHPLRA